jgi:AraC-like DNA-binding protein
MGGDPDAYARLAGLPAEALDTDELLVEDTAMAAVLELAAADLGCPDLGLRVGEAQDFSMLGPLSVAMQNSPSVGEALECTSRYMFVHARDVNFSLVDDPDGARGIVGIRYSLGAGKRLLPQAADMTMLFVHRAMTFLVGGGYGLRSVDLPHDLLAQRSRYEDAFGARARFNRAEALLRVPTSFLSRPLAGVDDTLRVLAVAFLSQQSPESGPPTVGRVRAVIDQSLGTGSIGLGDIARVLDVHPRTLQRQLAAEGASFASIVDNARRARARFYLTTTDIPLSQVGFLVGLAEQAILSRCARRWWGRTPTDMRREARATPIIGKK